MSLSPALRTLIVNAGSRTFTGPSSVELPIPHLVACLAELGLQKATKKELHRVVRTALAREAAEQD